MNMNVYDQNGQLVVLSDSHSKTLMQAIRHAGLNIAAQCGGSASCATCHVYVDPAWVDKLPPADDTELAMLDFAEQRQENSRLSCQIELTVELEGLTVTLAPGTDF